MLKLLFGIALGALILWIGLKFGFVGGFGSGVKRAEHPRLFWLAIGQNVVMLLILVIVFIAVTTGHGHL